MRRRNYVLHMTLGVFWAATVSLAHMPAQADEYPIRAVTLVVPYPSGGVADQFARSFGRALSERLGQPVVVDNRAGANGNIGSAYVGRNRAADGYTLLLGTLSTLAINPSLYTSMGYEPMKDLQPITLTHQMPNVMLVGAGSPYHSVSEVIKAAKAMPGRISYGSAGNGNTMHLAGVLFEQQTGISLLHVPYKGGAPAMVDVLAGQIPMMFNNLPAVVSHQKAGTVRILAVADVKRATVMPDVPTFAELGVAGVVSTVWNGILVRKGTPPEVVQRLNREMTAVLQDPEFRRPLEAQGYEVLSSSTVAFEALIRKDTLVMNKLLKDAAMKMD